MELLTTRMKTLYCHVLHLALSPNLTNSFVCTSGTDRTNVCWVKEGCSSLKPKACSSLPLDVVDHVDENLTPKSWTFTSTQVVTLVTNCRLSLITRQPPVIRHVSASQSLGSTVIWARAITTFPTDVTWDRLQSPMPHYLRNKTLLYYCSLNAHGFEYLVTLTISWV